MFFGEILVKNKIISNEVLTESQKKADKTGVRLEEILVNKNVSEHDIVTAKSKSFGIPVKENVASLKTPFDVLETIPEDSARHYGFVPLQKEGNTIDVGIIYPDDMESREALQFLASKMGVSFRLFLITPTDLDEVLKSYKSLGGEATQVLGELESTISTMSAKALADIDEESGEEAEKSKKLIEDAPATKMMTVILRHAVEGRASDVHIEPIRDNLRVRFRVDGVMHTSLVLPLSVREALVAKIKILTNLKLDEKRKPQDGRFEALVNNQHVDFRVSTFPTFFGEKVVIRILDPSKGLRKLEEVGLDGRNFDVIKEALKMPYGMILLTGPTGSGKTSTLYSMLSMLDRESRNVVSLEDPIEYSLEGINQSQVRPEIQYTFASGLRSVLRQDPDVIMVGEIRDQETARLAVQAALTGHLVFSTLHTNNSVGVIPRLINMGIEPYLLPSSLILMIAQRLVRTLCPDSKKELPVTGVIKEAVEREVKSINAKSEKKIAVPEKIYQAAASSSCPKGTSGRIGVFEVLQMTTKLKDIILSKPTESQIISAAKDQGMLSMREDGVLKVINGLIGLEELNEVIHEVRYTPQDFE